MIEQARVVRVDWKSNTVDLVMSDGRPISGVRVASMSASTNTGMNDLPMPDTVSGKTPFSSGGYSQTRDIIALVLSVGMTPVVIGFLHPVGSQMMLTDEERMVYRHASDVYHTIDKFGNMEIAHPSGAFIRVATDSAHEDLAAKSRNGNWKITRNTASQVHIHIEQAGGVASINIAPNGAITINSENTVIVTSAVSATVNAPSVTLNTPMTHCTGGLNVDGKITGFGGIAVSGGVGSAVQITGSVSASGDVTAGSISLAAHHHSDPQGGNTGGPM